MVWARRPAGIRDVAPEGDGRLLVGVAGVLDPYADAEHVEFFFIAVLVSMSALPPGQGWRAGKLQGHAPPPELRDSIETKCAPEVSDRPGCPRDAKFHSFFGRGGQGGLGGQVALDPRAGY